MHRQRTQFSRRVNRVFTHRADRVAKAVERRGIRATYELHDRVLSNRKSRGLYEADRPHARRRAAAHPCRRRGQGFSRRARSTSSSRTTGTGTTSRRCATASSSETEADLAKGGEHLRVRAGKEFVVRLHSYGAASPSTIRGSERSRRAACSTSRTPTSRCGRSSSTSTSGTRCRNPPRPSASRRSAGTATTTTSTC